MGWINGRAKVAEAVAPAPVQTHEQRSTEESTTPATQNHSTQELARFMPVMDIEQAMQRRQLIVEYTRRGMVEGTDYGKIPGAGERLVLLQPGADKLCNWFGLRISYETVQKVEDWSGAEHGGEPFFYYDVRAIGWRNDYLAGEGVGSCTSWESKYRWRKCERTCPNCGKENIRKSRETGWYCWAKTGGCGATFSDGDPRIEGQETGRKPNPDIFDQVNTVQKMAFKRAKVSCTINCLSASEFTQDMEDFAAEEPIDTGGRPRNTQAAADYVAQQKIANAEPIRKAEFPWKSVKEMEDAFNRMRTAIGEGAWLGELERYGWHSITDMKSARDAKRPNVREQIADVYWQMDRIRKEVA